MKNKHNNVADVVVIGAGAVGCATAYYLSLEGLRVHLMDREAIGSGASGHATGLLAFLWIGFRPGAAFEMGLASSRMFENLVLQLKEETNMELYYQQRPCMALALDEEEESLIRSLLKWQSTETNAQWISNEDVRKIEPRLTPMIRGAAWTPEAAQIDSYRFTLALSQAAEKHGATIQLREATGIQHHNGKVTGVTYAGGSISCNAVVLAVGASGKLCQKWLGTPIPVRPTRSERLMLQFNGAPLPALLVSPKRGHLISRTDGYWSVGSTGGRDYGEQGESFLDQEIPQRPSEQAKVFLLERALTLLPDLESAQVAQQIAGWYPTSADREPLIGPVSDWENLYLAMGHTFKGIHLAPITGSIIRDFILHGNSTADFDVGHVLPKRFEGQWQPNYKSGIDYIQG